MSTPEASTPKSGSTPDELLKLIGKYANSIDTRIRNAKPSVKVDDKEFTYRMCGLIKDTIKLLRPLLPDPNNTIIQSDNQPIVDVLREELGVFKTELRNELRAELQAEFKQLPAPTSYAEAAAKHKRVSVKTPVNRPSIILASGVPDVKDSKGVSNTFRTKLPFKDLTYAPHKLQPLSNGKVRAEFDDVKQRDETLKRLESIKELKAEKAKQQRPLIILKGVLNDTPKDTLVGILRRQNPILGIQDSDEDSIKLRFLRRNRKEFLYNAVFEVTPAIRVRLLELQRVNIDHQKVRVDEFSPFMQCFKCLQFGHTKSKCDSKCTPCSYCASKEHQWSTCPNKEDSNKLKCFNCDSENTKRGTKLSTAHSATSFKSCPKIKGIIKRVHERIDYGV